MRYKNLHLDEERLNTLEGSMSNDQIVSRLWMSKKLKETKLPINRCVVLGSWYGILPYVLNKYNNIDEIVAIDSEPGCVNVSQELNPTIRHIVKDCNKLKYNGADCVINPSINNIEGIDWYNNIPKGTLCLFQTEDVELGKGCPKNLQELKEKYPLREYLYEGKMRTKDSEGKFTRTMVIGYK